jgi:hypothetical protein
LKGLETGELEREKVPQARGSAVIGLLPTLYKRLAVLPSAAGMSLAKLSLGDIIKCFPARESLVSNIPAGEGKTDNFFYSAV